MRRAAISFWNFVTHRVLRAAGEPSRPGQDQCVVTALRSLAGRAPGTMILLRLARRVGGIRERSARARTSTKVLVIT